jgi:hypothetical protein
MVLIVAAVVNYIYDTKDRERWEGSAQQELRRRQRVQNTYFFKYTPLYHLVTNLFIMLWKKKSSVPPIPPPPLRTAFQ